MSFAFETRRLIAVFWALLPTILEGCIEGTALLIGWILPDNTLHAVLLLCGLLAMYQLVSTLYSGGARVDSEAAILDKAEHRS